MSKFLKRLLIFILLLLMGGIAAWQISWVRLAVFEKWYDISHSNPPIWTEAEALAVLEKFEQVSFAELDSSYLSYSQSNAPPFQQMLQGKSYYLIRGNEVFQRLAGPFRIRHFLSRDKYYRDNLRNPFKNRPQYLLLDPQLVRKLMALMQALEKEGHDPQGFTIRNGHRHPAKNKWVGGASKSRHIKGEALDLSIRDIDQNGKREQADKAIVLQLLNEKIIQSKGGIGRYPGTMSVHFDVRGYKARWDSY